MRVLHIASGDFFSTYGGGQVYVKNIVDQMIADQKEICVISSVHSAKELNYKSYKGADFYEISSPNILEKVILLAHPDIIHAHSLKSAASKIGKKLNIPVIVTAHHSGILCPVGTRVNYREEICHAKVNHQSCLPCLLYNIPGGKNIWYPLMRLIPQLLYLKVGNSLSDKPFVPFLSPIGIAAKHIESKKAEWDSIDSNCTLMLAPCREIAQAMIVNGLDKAKIRFIPHGIPLPSNRPTYPEVIDETIKFFYVGRICYVKGIHTLLEAFTSVDNPKIELNLFGGAGNKREGRYMAKLKKKYKNDRRIVWHGKIAPQAVYEAIRDFHVSISSSFLEAFGLNIAEALALGKPVLATRSGGAEEQIIDGVNGWLIPTNNPVALSAKIEEIINNSDRLAMMSNNCKAISLSDHCKAIYNVYKEVIPNEKNTD